MPALDHNHRAELARAVQDIRYACTRLEYASLGDKAAATRNLQRALHNLDLLVAISVLDPWVEQAARFYDAPPTLVNPDMRAHVKRMLLATNYAARGEYVATELTR